MDLKNINYKNILKITKLIARETCNRDTIKYYL